jgi:hypothetical protein
LISRRSFVPSFTHRMHPQPSRASWRLASRLTRTFQGQLFHGQLASTAATPQGLIACLYRRRGFPPITSLRFVAHQIGHPIDAWCLLPLVILRDVPYRYQFRGTGAEPPCLESADLPVIPTLGGSVAAFWELQHRAFDVDPAPGVPVLPRSDSRVHHVCTPTHTSPVPTSVLPSAYPLAFPVAFAS